MKIYVCNIHCIKDFELEKYLLMLPIKLQRDITRYRRIEDQKATLLGKLMLRQALRDDKKEFLLDKIRKNDHDKPFIEGWLDFNISHAGEFVLLACYNTSVGIDIEYQESSFMDMSADWLHWQEKQVITTALNPKKAFYDSWTKKEALLKAVGTGVVNELNSINCHRNSILYNNTDLYFHEIQVHDSYSSHICCFSEKLNISMIEFKPTLNV